MLRKSGRRFQFFRNNFTLLSYSWTAEVSVESSKQHPQDNLNCRYQWHAKQFCPFRRVNKSDIRLLMMRPALAATDERRSPITRWTAALDATVGSWPVRWTCFRTWRSLSQWCLKLPFPNRIDFRSELQIWACFRQVVRRYYERFELLGKQTTLSLAIYLENRLENCHLMHTHKLQSWLANIENSSNSTKPGRVVHIPSAIRHRQGNGFK